MTSHPHHRFTRPALFRAVAIAFLLMAGALFLTACGGEESALPPADTSSSAGSAPAAAAAPASAAPASSAAPAAAAPANAPANPSAPASAAVADPINVVAGNAILADLAARVGGERVTVHNLVPLGSDVHTWQSTPQDSVRIAEASVVISNGAGLSSTVEELIENAASADAIQVVASDGLEPQELVELPFPESDPSRRPRRRRSRR